MTRTQTRRDIDTRRVRFGDRERQTPAFEDAAAADRLVVQQTRFLFRVLTSDHDADSDGALVVLARDSAVNEWTGGCSCRGWHRDGRQTGRPCRHLWGVKRAAEEVAMFRLAAVGDGLDSTCPTCRSDGGHAPDRYRDDVAEVFCGP